MATQIITRILCDFCSAEDVTTPDARTVSVSIDGTHYDVDVCEMHGKPLSELAETLAEFGRKLPGTATERARLKPSRQPSGPGDGQDNKCPACGKEYNYRSSLTSHARSAHGVTLAELQGEPVPFKCDICERAFSTPQGVSVHQARKHGSEVVSSESDGA
jgi:hypothetical protein